MINKKKIAKYAQSFMGGTPDVHEYHNKNKSRSIDILTCLIEMDDKSKSYTSLSTIGLSEVDLIQKNIRVELAMAGEPYNESYAKILSNTAFKIQQNEECYYGLIVENVIDKSYKTKSSLKHVVLLRPAYWKKYKKLEMDEYSIVWLQVIPITDSEKKFIESNDIDKFDDILAKNKVDVIDLHRKNCI